jgi:glutathione S-transferase
VITLFYRPKTRAARFVFLLEELGAPYELRLVTTRTHDGSGVADPANPHPHGKVPAIRDDETVVFESPAIALYLTDRFPANRLGPLPGEPERGAYLSWLCYYGSVFEPAVMAKFVGMDVPRVSAGWAPLDEVMGAILTRLAAGPFMLGERFSALDVLYGTAFAMFAQSPFMPKSPLLDDYVSRVVSRPAFARAQAREPA